MPRLRSASGLAFLQMRRSFPTAATGRNPFGADRRPETRSTETVLAAARCLAIPLTVYGDPLASSGYGEQGSFKIHEHPARRIGAPRDAGVELFFIAAVTIAARRWRSTFPWGLQNVVGLSAAAGAFIIHIASRICTGEAVPVDHRKPGHQARGARAVAPILLVALNLVYPGGLSASRTLRRCPPCSPASARIRRTTIRSFWPYADRARLALGLGYGWPNGRRPPAGPMVLPGLLTQLIARWCSGNTNP